MSLLGVVKQVNELDIAIALPNQLTGYVSITEISDKITALVELVANADEEDDLSLPELDNLFSVGQPLVCNVISLSSENNQKRIDLSINPKTVNAKLLPDSVAKG